MIDRSHGPSMPVQFLLVGLAIVVAAISLAILAYLTAMVWNAARGPIVMFVEQQQLERHLAHLRRGERLMHEGATAEALAELEAALYPRPPRSAAMAKAVANLHTTLLSHLIVAADRVQGERLRLISLAKADRLFHERAAMQHRYVALMQSGSRQRLRALEDELRANTRELQATLSALAAEITASRVARYH